jgi:hypothetical protein
MVHLPVRSPAALIRISVTRMAAPAVASAGWALDTFPNYLYRSVTNATAFSHTDMLLLVIAPAVDIFK